MNVLLYETSLMALSCGLVLVSLLHTFMFNLADNPGKRFVS